MGRRVDVDEKLPPVAIPGRVLNELYAHSLETLPEECCGLIVSEARERFGRLVRCRNDMNQRHHEDPKTHPRDGRQAFWMNEMDYQRVESIAEQAGEAVTGVYHSHVGSGAYLSEMDLEYAEHAGFPFPEADHIVVDVFEGAVRGLAIFRRDGDGTFAGYAVAPSEPR